MIKYFLKADTATDKVAKAQTDRQTDRRTDRQATDTQSSDKRLCAGGGGGAQHADWMTDKDRKQTGPAQKSERLHAMQRHCGTLMDVVNTVTRAPECNVAEPHARRGTRNDSTCSPF